MPASPPCSASSKGFIAMVQNTTSHDQRQAASPQAASPQTITALELMSRNIPPQNWIIYGLLTEGVTLFCGKPKSGKSWLALAIALATAIGGSVLGIFAAQFGEALYLALEDSPRRLQDRLRPLLDGDAPAGLHLINDWQRLDQGGLEALDDWLTQHPAVRIVIIDTLQKVRPPQKPNANIYAEDYAAVAGLKALAEKHNVAIVLVHHLRKAKAIDPLDAVSGSTGLTGVVDAIWVLDRTRGSPNANLLVTGRDIEEQTLRLTWDAETTRWTADGVPVPPQRSPERQAVLDVLIELGQPMSPKEVAQRLGKERNSVKLLLWKMAQDGEVVSNGTGQYAVLKEHITEPTTA